MEETAAGAAWPVVLPCKDGSVSPKVIPLANLLKQRLTGEQKRNSESEREAGHQTMP